MHPSQIVIARSMIDDLDRQYLKIRAARKKHFIWDVLGDWMCKIDAEEWRDDEMVNWKINEDEEDPLSLLGSPGEGKDKTE